MICITFIALDWKEMENHDINFNRVFTRCYATFAGQLESYLLRLVRDRDTAKELVHDVFLRIFERRIALDVEMETTRFYLYKMAKNMAYDLLRKKKRQDACFDDIVLQEVCLNDQFYRDVESAYIEGEVISTLRDTILGLPEKSREVITLRGIKDMNMAEVVRETSLSKYHVARIEKDAMHVLRAKLEKLIGGWRIVNRRPLAREWKT